MSKMQGLPHARRDDSGFALVELIVSLFLVALMSGLAYGLYLFGMKAQVTWKRAIALQNDAELIAHRVEADLVLSREMAFVDDSTWVLVLRTGELAQYARRGTTLSRNGRLMHEENVQVDDFVLFTADGAGEETDERTLGRPVWKDTQHSVSLMVQVTAWGRTFGWSRTIAMRQPSVWRATVDEVRP
ncbi:MAG: prepilin-type N-terminal cleavage/methylation domain-containing protein [Bacteroidota bacterium]